MQHLHGLLFAFVGLNSPVGWEFCQELFYYPL